MEKLKTMAQKKPGLWLVMVFYAAGLVVFLAAHLFLFAQNRVLYATGALSYSQLSLDDFRLEGLADENGALVTLDADPRMFLKNETRRVESFAANLSYERPARVSTVFWAKPGQSYSVRRMAYSEGGAGEVFYLPAAGGQGFRFDPDAMPMNTITVESLEINIKRPFWAFFVPSSMEWMALAVAPGLLASGVAIARQAGLWPKRKKGAGAS